ncbi:MAG TPA: tetratricopeptide repeat protein [Lacunisphaera sp.]|nr:tetratricopeptide repeat protein [Lacunisphaera sp.]
MLRPALLPALAALLALSPSHGPALAADNALRDQVAELLRQRNWTEARTVLEQATVSEPGNAEAWQSLGQVCVAMGDLEKAVPALEKSTELAPTNSEYFRKLGDSYGMTAQKAGLLSKFGWAKKCKAAYEKSVELNPANIDARWSVMEYCRQAPGIAGGGMDGAYAQAEAIKKLNPARGRAAYTSLYLHEKKYADAFAQYEAVLKENPEDGDALFQIGRIASVSGEQLDRGLETLRKLLTLPGGATPRSYGRIGTILEKKGDKAGARAAYEAALALDPKFTPALESLRKL